MFAVSLPRKLTPSEYFDWEDQQELRYEYFDGQVFAMTGGSLRHADIALNIAIFLQLQLAGRCKVRNSDAKVGMSDQGPLFTPMLVSVVINGIEPRRNFASIPV